MRKIQKSFVVVCLIVCLIVFVCLACYMGNDGCEGRGTTQQSASGAKQAQLSEIPKNSRGYTTEQQNIMDRIRVTTDTTKVLWIHLIALDGKIIRRMPIRCKATSSGKRLEATQAASSNQYGMNYPRAWEGGYETNELIQPDGTYGHSDSYIYWFDPQGRYHQWGTAGGLGYFLTDYPIDLQSPIDEITGMYNVQEAALKWQRQQEALFKQQEGQGK